MPVAIDPMPPQKIAKIFNEAPNKATGARRVVETIRHGLREKKLKAEQVSIRGLALALGVMDQYDPEGSLRRASAQAFNSERMDPESMLHESNPGLNTAAFQIVTGELISSEVIAGYEDDSGFIGDQLVTNIPSRMRNIKMAGFTSLGGPKEVKEGNPYPETAFGEKYVVSREAKYGEVISINEELIHFDQTSEVLRRARQIGFYARQERDRIIVRGVQDADSSTAPVYRPNGSSEALYNTDGSNRNYIGSGNTTSAAPFQAAVGLQDWTDVETVLRYRTTEVLDDRIDGTKRPIAGLNGRQNVLLVPFAKFATAKYIQTATEVEKRTNSAVDITKFGNPVAGFIGDVLSSPFVDEVSSDDWYYGNFKRQFVWVEIWPLQTFVQGADSEAAFERDVVFRQKVRWYGGISALDTVHVTKVDGA